MAKVGKIFCLILNKPSKKAQMFLKFCQRGANLPNLATLILPDPPPPIPSATVVACKGFNFELETLLARIIVPRDMIGRLGSVTANGR